MGQVSSYVWLPIIKVSQNGDNCISEKCDGLAKVYIYILCDDNNELQLQVMLNETKGYLQETCHYTSKLSVSSLQSYLWFVSYTWMLKQANPHLMENK